MEAPSPWQPLQPPSKPKIHWPPSSLLWERLVPNCQHLCVVILDIREFLICLKALEAIRGGESLEERPEVTAGDLDCGHALSLPPGVDYSLSLNRYFFIAEM